MFTQIGPMTNSLIEGLIQEIKKKETKDKLFEGVVNPLIHDVSTRYYPYFVSIILILVVLIILLMSILMILIAHRRDLRIPTSSGH